MDTTLLLHSLSLLLPIFLLLVYLLSSKHRPGSKLPPGPSGAPIVGNILWLRKSLLELSRSLRPLSEQFGPLITLTLGPFPAIFVVDRRLAHEALITKGGAFGDRPAPRPGGATAVFTCNGYNVSSGRGPVWRLLRRNLTAEILHPSRFKSFARGREWVLRRLLADLREEAQSNRDGVVLLAGTFRHAMFRLLVFMLCGEELPDGVIRGIEDVQRDLLLIGWKLNVFDVMPTVGKIVLWKRWRRFMEIINRQGEVYTPIIEARRRRNSTGGAVRAYIDTLLDIDLPEEGGRKLTDKEVIGLCSEFFNAGTDTTATTVEWAMAHIVKDKQVQTRLVDEVNNAVGEEDEIVSEDDLQKMPYLKAVILETLRLHPPAELLLPHAMAEDADLGGYKIPKGAVVNFAVGEMGWDGEVWEEPMEFKPERFLTDGGGDDDGAVDLTGSKEIKMMPFGAGRRICPGMALAMLHLEYYLANMVREFEWEPEQEGKEVDLTPGLEFTVVMKESLRARITNRR